MKIERCSIAARHDLVRLRRMLWPESTTQDHLSELTDRFHAGESGMAVFIARTDAGEAAGFAEATLRHDPVNGCNTSPVLFLEGIFVLPDHRRRGVAKSLCEAVEAWGRSLGCAEFGSDALLENADGQAFHAALGFEECERVVVFRKTL